MLVEVVLFIIGIAVVIKYFHYGTKPAGTPPGVIGLPILGVIPPRTCTFQEFINNYRKKYGDIFWLKLGSHNMVYVCDYDDIVSALNNPVIQGRPIFFSMQNMTKGNVEGVVFSVGTKWKNLRRFAIRRLRDGGMGKSSIVKIILREAEALSEDFEKYVGKPTELPWSINGSILNVIWKLVSDQRYDVEDPKMHQFYITLGDMLQQLQGKTFALFDSMPWIAKWAPEFIQNLFGKKTFLQKRDKIFELIEGAVEEHKKTLDEDNPRDFIDAYLIELNKLKNDSESHPDNYSTFSELELVNTIFDLFAAGSETSSSTIRWYLLLMAKYPHIQSKVQVELDKVISRDRTVTLEDKENLPFLEATINETLRLKPILPFSVTHTATEDTTLKNFFIPKGTSISPYILGSHENAEIWEKPKEFYPEHFLKEDGTFNHKKQGLLTFSIGRRVCLGENLARMDLFFVLAVLMQRYSFTAPEGEVLSIEHVPDQPIFTLPKPFKLIINKR